MLIEYTDKDKLHEVRRELRYRVRVFARLVAKGTMTQAEADRRIEIMRQIAVDYESRLPRLDLFTPPVCSDPK